jgi:signal peptidase I
MPKPTFNSAVAEMVRLSLANGRSTWLSITSGSMRPLLVEGDEVLVEPVLFRQLRAGDVILLREPAGLLTHRFQGMAHGRLLTRGDRNLAADPPAQLGQLLGRVVARRRDGYLWDWRNAPQQWRLRGVARVAVWEQRWLPADVRWHGRLLHRLAGLCQTILLIGAK